MKQLLVIDVPAKATADEAEQMLNAVCGEYFLVAVHPVDGASRAFFKARRPHNETGGVGGVKADKDGKDDAARAFIAAHPEMTVPALRAGLEGLGIKRKKTWVTMARLDIRANASDKQEEDAKAVAFLRAHPDTPSRPLSKVFRAETGIHRSYKWFQRKRTDTA